MRKKDPPRLMIWLLAVALLALAGAAPAQDEVLVRCKPEAVGRLAARYGLTALESKQDLWRMRVPAGASAAQVAASLAFDPDALNAEVNHKISLPASVSLDQSTVSVLNQSTVSVLNQSTVAVLNALLDLTPTSFYGSRVSSGYVSQPAMQIVQNDAAHTVSTGSGVLIADIDNGVDPEHPALKKALVPGFNFIDNNSDVSVFTGLDQSTVSVLNQTLDLNQSTVAVLNQSTVAVLNQSTVSVLNSMPAAWAHGTEVAGVLRLVAPRSRIMPLKSFGSDGTGLLFHAIQAIYYAVDQSAQVINMSFSCDCNSRELTTAISYAQSRGAVMVGSVGNDNSLVRLFPASYSQVLGIASTNFDDTRAVFSNYGSSVFVSAPGAGVISAYPGGKWAAVWGTSFSSPMVAGQAALLLERGVQPGDVDNRIKDTVFDNRALNRDTQLGYGRIDLYRSVTK